MRSPESPLEAARQRFAGKTTTIIGLAREGLDLARFLANVGADVVITDRKGPGELQAEMTRLAGLPVSFLLGEHDLETLLETDLVFASPGVAPENAIVVGARARGIPVSSLVQLFFELCPAPIVGITGSAGKTTTTSLLGDIFRLAGRDVHVGGNIGRPLLGEIERITPRSWVVMELSSFQLEALTRSPRVATVTNVTPNHLDRHPSMEAYWEAKGQLLAHQGPDDIAVLNADDSWSQRYEPRGRVLRFSLEAAVEGGYLAGETLMLLGDPLMRADEVPLRGRHNLANVLAAAVTAHAAGIDRQATVDAVRQFSGVPHRLQLVGEIGGVRYFNDSIATSPERSIAALRAFEEPVVLVAGGRDKHLPMDDWAALIAQRARHVVLFGEMAGLVQDALGRVRPDFAAISHAGSMAEAVSQARSAAKPGDVVLLSPGGTSYDAYRDFEQRGADFERAVETERQRQAGGGA